MKTGGRRSHRTNTGWTPHRNDIPHDWSRQRRMNSPRVLVTAARGRLGADLCPVPASRGV